MTERKTTRTAGSYRPAPSRPERRSLAQPPDDGQLLKVVAFLTERQPYNVLRLAAWKAGEDEALECYRRRRPLPPRTRAELDAMLEERMRLEHGIAARCETDAAGLVTLLFDFLALAAVLFLLIG
ncbi:MAG: hypothetical protein WDZ84_14790 [Rhodovibrionaceae bacterium]